MDFDRLDIISTRNSLYEKSAQLTSLKKAGVDFQEFRKLMDQVGIGENLVLLDQVTLADGIPRSGRFDRIKGTIALSRTFWHEAKSDSLRKIGIQVHEFLGLMGVEHTDDYHLSEQVLNELRGKEIFSMPTSAVNDNSAVPAIVEPDVNGCPNLTGVWREINKGNPDKDGVFIQQEGCQKIFKRDIIKIDGKISWHFQDRLTQNLLTDGQTHALYGNYFGFMSFSPTDSPMIYQAGYNDGKLIRNWQSPSDDICKSYGEKLWIQDGKLYIEFQMSHCVSSGVKDGSSTSVYELIKGGTW